MKKVLRTIVLLCCLMVPFNAVASSDSAIGWLTYEEAQKLGTQNPPKKFFLYFYSDWCGYCRKIEKNTFMDKAVADYINNNFTPVRVNSEKLPKVAARYKVSGVPDIRFIDSKGEEIGRWPGYIEPSALLPLLKFIHTDSYLQMGYKDFLKQ